MNLGFYRYRTNWHSWPPLSRLLCWIGRHDYEFVSVDGKEHKDWGLLECIQCGQRKISRHAQQT